MKDKYVKETSRQEVSYWANYFNTTEENIINSLKRLYPELKISEDYDEAYTTRGQENN